MSLSKWVRRRNVKRMQVIDQLLDDLETQVEMTVTGATGFSVRDHSDQAIITRNAIRSNVLEIMGMKEEDLYG
jgi:hypothetical protein